MSFLVVWVTYASVGVAIYSLIFIWAVRSRQFSDQDRARYLSLSAEEIREPVSLTDTEPGKLDNYTWIALLALSFAVIFVVVFLGLRK